MIIIRDGKRIVLTREEMEAAHAIIQKEKETGIPADLSENGFKGDSCNSVVIPLKGNEILVAEANQDPEFREIFIGLGKADSDCWYQDLAIVGANYEYCEEGGPVIQDGKYDVHVYTDENSEDYTASFTISRYEGDEI